MDEINEIALYLTEEAAPNPYDTILEADHTLLVEDITSYIAENVGHIADRQHQVDEIRDICQSMLSEGYNEQLINEGLWSWLKSIGSGAAQTIKEHAIGMVLRIFGIKQGTFMYDYLTETLANVGLRDIPKLFTSCEFLMNKLVDGLSEYFIRHNPLADLFGHGLLGDSFGNAIASSINDDGFVEQLEQKLLPKLCAALKMGGQKFATMGAQQTGQDQGAQQTGQGAPQPGIQA